MIIYIYTFCLCHWNSTKQMLSNLASNDDFFKKYKKYIKSIKIYQFITIILIIEICKFLQNIKITIFSHMKYT